MTEATHFSQCVHDQQRRLEAEDCDSIRCAQLISGGRRRIRPPCTVPRSRSPHNVLLVIMVRPSPARRVIGRTKITREVDRKSPTYVHVLASANITVSSCCIFRQSATVAVSFDIGSLQYGFYKSSTRLRTANPGITDERDSFNEGGSERGTAVTQRQRYKGRNG